MSLVMTRKQVSVSRVDSPVKLEDELPAVIARLCGTLVAVIEGIPSPLKIARPVDLVRALGIRPTLAWQVFRVAYARDSMIEVANLPGQGAMKKFFDAARQGQAPPELVEAASKAVQEYHQLVKTHAPDRAEFSSILAGVTEGDADHVELHHRRLAFRGNSHIFGLQADTHLSMYIFRRNAANPGRLDMVGVRGMLGLRQFRPGATWTIATMTICGDDGTPQVTAPSVPISPEHEARDTGLLPSFCSRPTPLIHRRPTGSGMMNFEVEPHGVGAHSSVTCFVGQMYPASGSYWQEPNDRFAFGWTNVRTPCRTLVCDMLMPKDLLPGVKPELLIHARHRMNDPTLQGQECDRLQLNEKVIYLGRGPKVIATPDVPRYEELARYVFDRIGSNADEFDVWRVRIEYPVMPSSVIVRFDLPEAPAP